MRKFSFLIGALGGALGGYLLSKPKLVEQLSRAKDATHAAKMLGKQLQQDGQKLAREVKEFVESDEVQENISKAKKFAQKKFQVAKREVGNFVREESKSVKKKVRSKVKKSRR